MENLQNIGQSFLFYSFLKRFKTSIVDVQAYYPEIIALSSDILITKISEKMALLEELQKEPEKIELSSISQIYFSFDKSIAESQYVQRLSSCFFDFSHSQNHPINQLEYLQISQEIKTKIKDILLKLDKKEINENESFPIYNSTNNIYQKKSKKINFIDDIVQIFASNNISDIPVNFKSSLLQLQKMIDDKTNVQKILQMKPFFSRNNINLDETKNTPNECSDSEFDSEYSGSASGSESELKPNTNIKINEISNECEHPNYTENESSSEAQNEHAMKLKIELDNTLNNLKCAESENTCLKTKIEKLLIENVEIKEKLQDIDELRKEQIKVIEENALLKKENEQLKNVNDDNSSSTISLIIASSSNLNNIFEQSNKDTNDFDSNISKNNIVETDHKNSKDLTVSNIIKETPNLINLSGTTKQNELKDPNVTKDTNEPITTGIRFDIKDPNEFKEINGSKDLKKTNEPPKELKETNEPKDLKETKEQKDLKETNEPPKDMKETNEPPKDMKETNESPKDLKEVNEPPKDPKETNEPKDLKETKEQKDLKEVNEPPKDLKETKEQKNLKETNESPKDLKEANEPPKDPKETKELPKDLKETKESKELKETKEVKDSKYIKDTKDNNSQLSKQEEENAKNDKIPKLKKSRKRRKSQEENLVKVLLKV